MLIKVITDIIVDVKDDEEAQHASAMLDTGLDGQLRSFPVGQVITADVDHYEKVTDEEANEKGWVE